MPDLIIIFILISTFIYTHVYINTYAHLDTQSKPPSIAPYSE